MKTEQMVRKTMRYQIRNGFSLVEMAVVIAVLGALLGGVLMVVRPIYVSVQEARTKEKMEIIADAIASYAAVHYRVPCPAPPLPRNNAAAGYMYVDAITSHPACATNATRVGVVPYMTLNIDPDLMLDAWGRPFTYAVSPVFAMIPTGTADDDVYRQCRTRKWAEGGTNINPEKAAFCCPSIKEYAPTTDIDFRMWDNTTRYLTTPTRDTTATDYADVDVVTEWYEEITDPHEGWGGVEEIAFLLISHGGNGSGSYLIDSSTPTNRSTAMPMGTLESENADHDEDFIFVINSRNSSIGNNYYDDILLWRTQYGVMRELGNDSCIVP